MRVLQCRLVTGPLGRDGDIAGDIWRRWVRRKGRKSKLRAQRQQRLRHHGPWNHRLNEDVHYALTGAGIAGKLQAITNVTCADPLGGQNIREAALY